MAVRVPNEQRQHNHLGFRIDDGGDVDDFGLMCRNRFTYALASTLFHYFFISRYLKQLVF